MKRLLRRLLTLITILLVLTAWGDSGQLYTSSMLPSSLINCITQDKYGFIWVGTDYGLSRFDGYHFVNYLHHDNDSTSISDNIISSFLVDKQGRLWVGSAKGLMQYDYSNDSFRRYALPDGRNPRIYSIIEGREGNILVGSAGYGLYSIAPETDAVTWERQYMRRDSDEFFTHIYEDSHGTLWQASHLPTFRQCQKVGGKVRLTDFHSACGAPVAFFERQNRLVIVCMFGIIYYDYATGKIADAGYDFGPYKGNITINTAVFDRQGNLFLGTSESGVLTAARGTRKIVAYDAAYDKGFDLKSSFVNAILSDKDNNLWVGCYQKGLLLVNQEHDDFMSWTFDSQDYNIGSSVSSIAQGSHGDTWCTVQNSGVFRFDRNGNITAHPQSPAGTSVIYRDKQGKYWLGTGNALYSYVPETGQAQQKLRFESAGIYSIADDGKGKLFISVYSKGLYVYDTQTDKLTILTMSDRGKKGYLCNDWVRSLYYDGHGRLWIATSNGVCNMNTSTLSFNDLGWTKILPDILSNAICADRHGNIVIGTDNGLYIYNVKTLKTGLLPGSDMLRDKQVSAMTTDRQGNIWISTTMGIWQYNAARKQFYSYINGNGLTSHEYMLGSMMRDADDRIAFGTADGITTFYPEVVNGRKEKLGEVYLTGFMVNGKSRSCMGEHFTLPYKDNTFLLEFSMLNYKRQADISFDYRINSGRWTNTGEGINTISFTQLEPGHYNIEVRASFNGIPSEHVKRLSIEVEHPWYASGLAILIYLILGGSLFAFVFRNYEKRRQADLDEQKMKFLINATHDIRSPLTLIMGPLRKLKKRITDADNQADIDIIERNAQRLMLLVNQILDERKIDKKQMRLQCQDTDLVDFVANILRLYKYYASDKHVSISLVNGKGQPYQIKHPAVRVWIDRVNFDKVVSNLLSNAMKYTSDNGHIDIEVSDHESYVCLKVIDDGIGFRKEDIGRLFERFYQGRNSSGSGVMGTGIGLNLCHAIVEMHGGSIKAYNREDGKRGACIEVRLRKGCRHLRPEEIMEDSPAPANTDTKRKNTANRNLHILVVDDDYEIARYISGELGTWYRFDYASNGKDALGKLLNNNYDLVISDVVMPEMDGIALLKKIKGNSNISDIPVILLTSKTQVADKLEGLKKGADAYMAKPFNMDELHVLIDNLVDNVRRLRGKYSGAQRQTDKVERVKVKGNNDALMERIMKCVNENMQNPDFNVEMLTEEVGISRAQLHRKMKEITGISTAEFIRNLRLEQAAKLLVQGNINVTQVAYAVGFNNQAHFSTAFKKHFGMTPTEYYETNRNES